jgi:hypothetical protein
MEWINAHPQTFAIICSIIGMVIGYYMEKLRKKAPDTETKFDDNIVKIYDTILKFFKTDAFKKIAKSVLKFVEVKYEKDEIKKEERYAKFKEIMTERIENGLIYTEIPEDWEKILDEVIDEHTAEDKYEKMIAEKSAKSSEEENKNTEE